MKQIISLIGILAAISVIATPNLTHKTSGRDLSQLFASQGGLVNLDTTKKTLLIAFQDDNTLSAISDTLAKIEIILRVPISRRKVEVKGSPYQAAKALQGENTPGVILFHTCENEPSLAIYPETGIACVNVTVFRNNGDTLFKERLGKETWRAVGFTLGGYGTINGNCILQPIYSVEQLDAITTHTLGPMRVNGVFIGANKLGLPTRRQMTYVQACRIGVAPPPTNDVQKAIWEKVRSDKERGPTNPITIPPPKK